jgi:predicted enzyme related to lactoylglutathione lyase
MAPVHRVVGVGGVFFKANDPDALAAWYHEHLGVPIATGAAYGVFSSDGADGAPAQLVWSAFPANTTYFAPSRASFMINYRVTDLDAMLAQLRDAGATVDDHIEESEFGRFGWAMDPEGNRFELWQPPAHDPG